MIVILEGESTDSYTKYIMEYDDLGTGIRMVSDPVCTDINYSGLSNDAITVLGVDSPLSRGFLMYLYYSEVPARATFFVYSFYTQHNYPYMTYFVINRFSKNYSKYVFGKSTKFVDCVYED